MKTNTGIMTAKQNVNVTKWPVLRGEREQKMGSNLSTLISSSLIPQGQRLEINA